ncbi:hypothetical protein RRX38_02730 [Pseudomonas sp. DTU_2021_1001937_2_SI_NGA_ILE_001]|uniref:hypothetical protein n=1 Tax=Pseudomonas sp. DTU_2021_1001937_2_SI_NGA_ILE_001 TaxID=3077589 RepID=UPI0028FC2767|nr:hypothetical protein [Pseudomonas sp. DTU_2021_1001937_2_SI_NGA_ILE_001]WNW10106.1 hypothetical protein RRX38_02730 [Pseudomonas sp. DTU_2021_1001937_2_SI_NGA_ILE_001]
MATKVAVINSDLSTTEIAYQLKDHGTVVVDLYSRPGAHMLREHVSAELGCSGSTGDSVSYHQLEIWAGDDMPSWINVLFYSPLAIYHPRASRDLVERAMTEWERNARPEYFLYVE